MKRFLLFAIFTFSFLASNVHAEVRALLLALEQYQQHKLAFVENDIKELSSILEIRIRGDAKGLYELAPEVSDQNITRYRNAAFKEIKNWLSTIHENDTAILYISGHGMKGEDGKLYWLMNNFDEKHWNETTIAISEIRERLASCPAKYKLLLLDACYSGTTKAISRDISVGASAKAFKDVPGLVTIASSTEDQESLVLNQVQHSLFTFWLIQAFNGAADTNEDGYITFEELKRFLSDYVPMSANLQKREQNPVFLNEEVLDDNFKFELRPLELVPMYKNIAEQIDAQMRVRNLNCLAIPDFSSGISPNANDGKIASLIKEGPRKVVEFLKAIKLGDSANIHYRVLSSEETMDLIQKGKIARSEIGTDKTGELQTTSKSDKPSLDVDAIFCGQLQCFDKAGLQFTGKLVLAQSGEEEIVCHSIGLMQEVIGNKQLPDYEALGMAGRSMIPPPYGESRENGIFPDENTPHPLSDLKNINTIANIRIFARPAGSTSDVEYEERQLTFNGNRCDVVLREGEEYMIRIDNNTGKKIFPRVLVDGLNTLDQYVPDFSKEKRISEEKVFAPRVSLPEARCWILDPDCYARVEGFYITGNVREDDNYLMKGITDDGESKVCRFRVVDANEVISDKNEQFTEQIGVITVGIYEAITKEEAKKRELTKGPDIRTYWNEPITTEMEVSPDEDEAGFPLMIVNIHYSSK